ncbi:MAG: amylo-alpha-1,6-glucosidase [Tannerella sp.]|jgi:glycogen debranching enzyme|nr:amylo-alpha-1,6-glucosidase [Tannerella sp.]
MKKVYLCILAIIVIGGCFLVLRLKQNQTEQSSYIKEISNEGKTKDKPYLTAGDKANVIGTQDGLFPDMGGHVPREMGGVWTHPIKLADGYWLKISDDTQPNGVWLMSADEFITYPHGSEFCYHNALNGLDVKRFQFVPNHEKGVIIDYTVENRTAQTRKILFDFVLKTDLSPVWFSKENGIIDYPDQLTWDDSNEMFYAHDSLQSWCMVWGTNNPIISYETDFSGPVETAGQGRNGLIRTSLTIDPGKNKTLSFVISGSENSHTGAVSCYQTLFSQKNQLLSNKLKSFDSLLNTSKIMLPDKQLETAYNWVKINTRWLELDLDNFGHFLGAGAIEYPWLFGCDNSYAQQGVLAIGDFELAKSTLTSLKNISEQVNGNGRIIHEMSSNGYVYNKGNTQETAHFIIATWKTFLWTGDMTFLRKMYPYVKKGINWLTIDMDTNRNLFPEGYGIMEVRGLNAELIDVAVYTQQALAAASSMAEIFDERELSTDYAIRAATLKDKINSEFWDDRESIYCDFYGSKEQAVSVTTGAIQQLESETSAYKSIISFYKSLMADFKAIPDGVQRGWFTNKNWVITTPMETAIAPEEKAIRSLNKIRNEHCGEYGPYLSAVERKSMMTISTGVQAVSEAQYGRTDECLWYMNLIASTLNQTLPGSINEMMPDYGCPVQAWTIYGLAVPLITHIFGVNPDAYHKTVILSPSLPSAWDNISLENQKVGTNSYDIQVKKANGKMTYIIKSKENDWNNVLMIKGLSGNSYELNGKIMTAANDSITLIGTENIVRF